MSNVKIDFNKELRPMKPLHGVNNGPLTCNLSRDARPLFKEAGIPFSRLHDTEYPFGSGEFVDVPCIFKDFRNDVNDPESYNFALTDEYLKAIIECNTKIIYRLGVTIEHQAVKRHVYPPKDYQKWAEICEHIIAHYNEGWADGFHFGIERWEIWNEPNHSKDGLMWLGSPEDFAHFYTTAATHLKNRFPNLKIGGPAFSNPESKFVDAFFDELTKDGNHPPMDFFSWHGYIHTIEEGVHRAEYADDLLKKYGYGGIESIYDEWNYVKSWSDAGQYYGVIQSVKGAAFNAALLSRMQSTPVDIMAYYDAQFKFAGGWCGLFRTGDAKLTNGGANVLAPKRPFFAFKAFNEVYKCKTQVEMTVDDDRVYGVAAYDKENKKAKFILSSFADLDEELPSKNIKIETKGLEGKTATVYLLSEQLDLEEVVSFKVSGEFDYKLEPYTFILVSIE